MGKGPKQQTVRQEVDPRTQAFLEEYRRRALGEIDRGPSGALQGAFQRLLPGLEFAGQTGLQGIEGFFNPFQQSVIGGLQSDFDRQRQLANVAAQQEAVAAGAFGGDRGEILKAELLGGVGRNEAQTLAGVRQQGFANAANQLFANRQMLGNLGLAGLGGLQGLDQHRLAQLQMLGGAIGPFGQTTSQPLHGGGAGGFLKGALGGAATGSAIPGIGTVAGGILGGLGGLFG